MTTNSEKIETNGISNGLSNGFNPLNAVNAFSTKSNINGENGQNQIPLHKIGSYFDDSLSESLTSEEDSASRPLSALNAEENPYNSDAGTRMMIRNNLNIPDENYLNHEMDSEDGSPNYNDKDRDINSL
jgi:hypothetical protein